MKKIITTIVCAVLLLVVGIIIPVSALSLPFKDISTSSWYYNAVSYVYNNSLFSGTSQTTFSPNSPMTRAMLVTVLFRLDGSPYTYNSSNFTDVENIKWYASAISWAYAENIVTGVSKREFAPNSNITREQMALIFMNYTKYNGIDVSGYTSLSGFKDSNKVSTWAKNALSWAVSEGLISGIKDGANTYLDPQGKTTRAQVATIMQRYCENIIKKAYSNGLEYKLVNNGCEITGIGTCKDTDIVTPKVIDGEPVVRIGENAFANCNSIRSVTITNGVYLIGKRAFYGCGSLEEVTIPESVKYIESQIFYQANNLKKVTVSSTYRDDDYQESYLNNGSIEEIVFDGKYMPRYYLRENTTIKTVTITGNTEKIEDGAFMGCKCLKTVNISDGVADIGEGVFEDCTSLTSVSIPESVTSLSVRLFAGCSSLSEVILPKTIKSIGWGCCRDCYSIGRINLPDNVTTIQGYAFYHCTGVTTANLGNSLIDIGEYAFYGCTNLNRVTMPDTVTNISEEAFACCSKLGTIKLSSGLINISDCIFWNCSSLTSITVPSSITHINASAFYDCDKLSTINYSGTTEQWKSININKRRDRAYMTVVCNNGKLLVMI